MKSLYLLLSFHLLVAFVPALSYSFKTVLDRSHAKISKFRVAGLGGSILNFFKAPFGIVRSDDQLKSGIARFYDECSEIWLETWGEHMHHGYYPTLDYKDHKAAQVDMIERYVLFSYNFLYDPTSFRSLNFAYKTEANFIPPKSMVDIGCGVGGSSRLIAKKYGCVGKGISLSPYQIKRATEFTKEAGLDSLLEYRVEDATKSTFPNNSFDLGKLFTTN